MRTVNPEAGGSTRVVAGSGGISGEVARGFGSGVFATTLLPLHPARAQISRISRLGQIFDLPRA